MLSKRRPRRGFTLAEVLVAFTLIAILAAVIVPTIQGRLQEGYEDAMIAELSNLASAVTAYRQDVGKYPPALDYLTALRASPVDRCGTALSPVAIASWRGPYVTRTILNSARYIFAQRDTINDALTSSASPIGIIITVLGPDTLTAHNVDVRIDGTPSATTGGLQWTPRATDAAIEYIIPAKPGAC